MNKYLVTIRIKGQLVKTTIEADSAIHAKLIAEWHFGIGSVANAPTRLGENAIQAPLTPEKARVKALQAQVDRAKQAVKNERARQKIKQGQKELGKVI